VSEPGFKKWTEADDARLRELHATGLSFSKIAREMGLTSGQVHGRVWKLRLPQRRPKKATAE
jgi:hypothetical protein